MGVLLAKALAVAVISYSPCPGLDYTTSCAIPPNLVYLSPVYYYKPNGTPVYLDGIDRLNIRNHELGHVIDYNFLTNRDRGIFLALTRDKRPWVSPPNSPHERFAEAVRLCAVSTRRVSHYEPSGYGYEPTLRTHRRVCRWLATLG